MGAGPVSYDLERLVGRGCCTLVWTTTLPTGSAAVVEERRAPQAPEAVRAWLEQARTTRAAGLTEIYELRPHHEGALVAREPMPGETLEQILARVGRFDDQSVTAVANAVAGSLARLHHGGLAHGAPDPERVWWLADPRIALGLPSPHRWDPSGDAWCAHANPRRVARTPPEQLNGAECDARSDVFVWAALLVELASGAPPFLAADDVPATARRVTQTVPAGVDAIADPTLRRVVGRALSKDPDLRPPDARAVQAELAAGAPTAAPAGALGVVDDGPPEPPPVGPDRRTRRWRRCVVGTALLAVVATAALIALLADGRPQAPPDLVTLSAPEPIAVPAPDLEPEDGAAPEVRNLVEVVATPCGQLHRERGGTQVACIPAGVVLPVVDERDGWVEVVEADASSAGWLDEDDVRLPANP